MRVSTSQIYDAGALNIQRNQAATLKTYNQISSGRRILTPADDPVAAAQALVVTQSQAVEAQHVANQGSATSQLGLVDNRLTSLTNLLQSVRSSVVQAGNTTLTPSDRQSIATDLESSLNEMLGIANSDNGSGDFLFSGYQGGTRPFAIDAVIPPATTSPVTYYGDDGERLLQVSSSRQMEVSVPGSDVFMNVRNGNGTFVAATGMNGVTGAINQGTGVIDTGSVLDPQQWQQSMDSFSWLDATKPGLQIKFTSATTYQLYDVADAAQATPLLAADATFSPGQAIPLATTTPPANFGAQVIIQGQPKAGDTFTINPSSNQSIFQTMQNLIGILRTSVGTTTNTSTQYSNDLAGQLTNIDQAINNVGQVQATVGTHMRELDSLGTASSDLAIQYSTTLSDLQELDYNKALTDYAKQQVSLEAAQKAFVQISGLSLFKYL